MIRLLRSGGLAAVVAVGPGGTVWMLSDGTQRGGADPRRRSRRDLLAAAALNPDAPTGTFEVSGATVYTLDGFVRRINPSGVTVGTCRQPPRGCSPGDAAATPALVDVLTRDSVTAQDTRAVAGRFGVTLHDAAATLLEG